MRQKKLQHGLFVTFEGGEGSGKSTQIYRLAQYLEEKGGKVVVTREPGGTPLAERIRQTLLDQKNKISTQQEILLYELARRDHVMELIRPALRQGKIVLCDRFIDATLAYQGYGRGLSLKLLETCNQVATGGLMPDLTLLFDLPVSVGLARSKNRLKVQKSSEGRFEALPLAFHHQVRSGYLTLAAKDRKRIVVIDASGTKNNVFKRIQKSWEQFSRRRPA